MTYLNTRYALNVKATFTAETLKARCTYAAPM